MINVETGIGKHEPVNVRPFFSERRGGYRKIRFIKKHVKRFVTSRPM